ncbi:MAG: DNA polymerase III subunit alpha [Chloroflexi bacterium]|nr:DNA polymerase III subunit alpha [Chloroflexota bacterium]
MFTHLHVHSEYSLLDGMCRIPDLVRTARHLGMDSLALTDHGVLYGALEFYTEAREAGVKPIIGCEMYVAPGSRHARNAGDKSNYHLTLLCRNETGYRNLLQLVTKAHTEGFYYKPRVDKELLEQHHEGLVALSGCPSGEVMRLLRDGLRDEAAACAAWHRDLFGDFYLELQDHGNPEFQPAYRELVALARRMDLPLVATNDTHYLRQEDASVQEVLLCIGTNSTMLDGKRMRMDSDTYYLRSAEEMAEVFREVPDALVNTQRIAEMCNLQLEFNRLHLPEVEVPDGLSPDEYLRRLCQDGLHRRYERVTPEIEERLNYELNVIRETQFANYILVVWDIISFARRAGILFGVRGSGAGSIVLYCLGITEQDPLAHRLVFERFLNIERREMPDIDLDFADDRRDEVIAYVANKYGRDHVAQIITFGTLGARAVLRDVGRALGMTYADVDRVVRLVPMAPHITIDRALEESPQLKEMYLMDPTLRGFIDRAKRLEGIARHASTHAAGVVISREPLTNHVPLQRSSKGGMEDVLTTQFAMGPIAKIGLLKMDVLGLINLTILGKTREIIKETRGIDIQLDAIPEDDAKAYGLLASGETTGIFQLESAGMRRYIKDLRPSSLHDLAAMVALYRPGPMQHIPEFIRKKHGQEAIRYLHPAVAGILEETYGVIVYQDQVLLIAQAIGGYSLGRADILRRAMGKKIPEVMKEERAHFVAGAKAKGHAEELAEQIFDLMEPFAGYAFNKAHAVCYASIAYQTAYFKANFSVEYMTAVLMMYAGTQEKVSSAMTECRRLGIPVLPPHVNYSRETFAVERLQDGNDAIRFGLANVKNVGEAAIKSVLEARESGGIFTSVEDFCRRVDLRGVNKRVLESLIKVGALDCLGERGALLAGLDRVVALSQREQKLRESGQASMFNLWGDAAPTPLPSLDLGAEAVSSKERLGWEKELLGAYMSEHPFGAVAASVKDAGVTFCGQVDAEMEGQTVVVAGMVGSTRVVYTRDRKPFIGAVLEDLDGSLEATAWPEVYRNTEELWVEGNVLLVEGKVRLRDDRPHLYCERVRLYQPEAPLEAAPEPPTEAPSHIIDVEGDPPEEIPPASGNGSRNGGPRRVVVRIAETGNPEGDLARLMEIRRVLDRHPGADGVRILVSQGSESVPLDLPNISAAYGPELRQELMGLVGESGSVYLAE